MKRRVVGLAGIGLFLAVAAAAQTRWAPPRTPDGHPDLQGYWDFGLATPLERPRELADKAYSHGRGSRRIRTTNG